jgi:hypothetical protein
VVARARNELGEEMQGRYELVPTVHAYIKYLQEQAKWDDASETRYAQLRNQKMASEAAMADLKLMEIKGALLRKMDVEFIVTNMITATKSHMLSIASRVARLVLGQTKFQVVYDLIYNELELALRELSTFGPDMFVARNTAYLASQGADPRSLTAEGPNGEVEDQDELEPE